MAWYLINKRGRYGVRSPHGLESFTDTTGRLYTRRTAIRDCERFAAVDNPTPTPTPTRCPVCRRSTKPDAMLPCNCPAAS